jgi:hypothetical protein
MIKKTALVGMIVLTLLLAGCSQIKYSTQKDEQLATEDNQKGLRAKNPIPKLDDSLELKNLNARLEFLNKADRMGYVYLINFGKVMSFYTIRGKISSVNSYTTTSEQIIDRYGNPCGKYDRDPQVRSSEDCYVVESPDLDGSYGSNGDGIFFFTTEGAYVEYKGDYMYSSEPLKLTTQPELVREIK